MMFLKEFPSYSFELLLTKHGYGHIKIFNEWIRKGLLEVGHSELSTLEKAYNPFDLKPKPTKRFHEMINSGVAFRSSS